MHGWKIIGLNIDKILAEKKSSVKGKVEIKSNVDVKDIQKESISIPTRRNTRR